MNKKLIEIGECRKPHGIKGDLQLYLYQEGQTVLHVGMKVHVRRENEESFEDTITALRGLNHSILGLKSIQTRDEAEKTLPIKILVDRSDFPKVDDGEYYLCDLIGLVVKDFQSKEILGTVRSFYENGQQVVLEILLNNNDIIDIIFINQFVPEVNLEKGYLEVNLPLFED